MIDIQGLELVVPGKKLNDGFLVQEKVPDVTFDDLDSEILVQERVLGTNFFNFVRFRIDPPKKALERLCGLMCSLYALEKAGIIHDDLHAQNIMVEKKKLPDEVITAKVDAKARQITGITAEETDLTVGNKRALNEARARARASLTPEDLYEYIFRIIDFGNARRVNVGEIHENPSRDMYDIGMLMPFFLFGHMGMEIWEMNEGDNQLHLHFVQTARAKLIQDKKNFGNTQDQLALEIMSLEDNTELLENEMSTLMRKLTWLHGQIPTGGESIPEKIAALKAKVELSVVFRAKTETQTEFATLQTEIATLRKEIAALQEEEAESQEKIDALKVELDQVQTQFEDKSRTYETIYSENIQKYKARFENDLKTETGAIRKQYIMEKFNEANTAMQAAIGESYPESVLEELAQFTADCLSVEINVNPDGSVSVDPAQVLTAKEGYQKITNLRFFSGPTVNKRNYHLNEKNSRYKLQRNYLDIYAKL